MGRARKIQSSSTARRDTPDDSTWSGMHFMVFDLPENGGTFNQHLKALRKLIRKLKTPYGYRPAEQTKVAITLRYNAPSAKAMKNRCCVAALRFTKS